MAITAAVDLLFWALHNFRTSVSYIYIYIHVFGVLASLCTLWGKRAAPVTFVIAKQFLEAGDACPSYETLFWLVRFQQAVAMDFVVSVFNWRCLRFRILVFNGRCL